MPCYSPLKGYRNFVNGRWQSKRGSDAHEEMEVACGQCLGCRLDRACMWMVRIVHESSLHQFDQGSVFVTLTYRNKSECTEDQLRAGFFVPDDWSLCKEHFTKFMKRLRKKRDSKIRYFQCGEYGSICRHGMATTDEMAERLEISRCAFCRVGRPHHHACLFNVRFDDLRVCGRRDGVTYFTSDELASIWKYGFVQVGEITPQSAGYVARYSVKKVTGKQAREHYVTVDDDGVLQSVLPEYATMSRGGICEQCGRRSCSKAPGGIGKRFYERYIGDIFPSDEVPVPGRGVLKKVPRFYDELLCRTDPELLEEIKLIRQEFRKAHGDEYTPERLYQKYRVKKAQVSLLKGELK